jgi:hypothetical protein
LCGAPLTGSPWLLALTGGWLSCSAPRALRRLSRSICGPVSDVLGGRRCLNWALTRRRRPLLRRRAWPRTLSCWAALLTGRWRTALRSGLARLPCTGLLCTGLPYTGLPYTGLPYTGLPYTGLSIDALTIDTIRPLVRRSDVIKPLARRTGATARCSSLCPLLRIGRCRPTDILLGIARCRRSV